MSCIGRAFRLLRTQAATKQFMTRRHVSRPFSTQYNQSGGSSNSNASWNWGALRKTVLVALGASATVYVGSHMMMAYRGPVHALKSRKVCF